MLSMKMLSQLAPWLLTNTTTFYQFNPHKSVWFLGAVRRSNYLTNSLPPTSSESGHREHPVLAATDAA